MGYQSHPQRYLTKEVISKVVEIASYHSVSENNLKTFVIGDIHGMDILLLSLLEFVTEKAKEENIVGKFIFLGDYVDRGVGVAQVLAIVRLFQECMPKGRVITLMGNHEDIFLGENLRYHRDNPDFYHTKTGKSFSKYGHNALPPRDLLEWMDKLPHYYEDDLHLYVHAGIHPEMPMERQIASDLLWIRDEFLRFKGLHYKYVIHGHTPKECVDLQPNRCGIDTGACFSKDYYLTCAEIDSKCVYPVGYLQVRENDKKYIKIIDGHYREMKERKEEK